MKILPTVQKELFRFSSIELQNLTQIISGSQKSTKEVSILFNKICKNTIICMKEAEIININVTDTLPFLSQINFL